ncbi:MAG: uroporphyrinogen-III C-methyltransferase [Porticoccaceae bacterium]|nr:uroporphyrinogen-III C-methyltransferase [Porticoccaceae bacterium]
MLLVLIALAAGGYYLWPQYGDRILALAGVGASEDTAQSQPPQTVSLTGEQGAEDGSEGPAELAAQDSESSLVVDPATSELIDQERSARQEMATELRDQMADLELRLNSHADRLRQLSTTSRDDWLLAEAEYLLRLASQRLLTERQTTNAAALMESADVILRDMSDPALYPVRKALAENITQIRLANPVDREGIFLRIGALADAVDSLNSLLPDTAVVTEVTEAAEPTSWYGRLWGNVRQAARNMVGLIRVERRDVPLQPLLTLEQEQVLRYNLKVVLEQARLALLREEQVIYADSLSRASSWVAEHFAEDARTAAFMAELEQLAAQSVSQELPSVTPSLQALQAYIRLWHNRHDPGAAPGASGDVQDGSESP